jgi:hypothetical protein
MQAYRLPKNSGQDFFQIIVAPLRLILKDKLKKLYNAKKMIAGNLGQSVQKVLYSLTFSTRKN